MEDILASIKRIIAEDSETATAKPSRSRKGPVAVPDVAPDLEPESAPLTETAPSVAAFDTVEAEPESHEPSDVLELTSPLVEPYEELPMAAAEPRREDSSVKPAAAILSSTAETASRNAFAALSQLQMREEGGQPNTLEGLVGDLLRPMLRDWLDANLPAVVERIVEAEVKRVSGRG